MKETQQEFTKSVSITIPTLNPKHTEKLYGSDFFISRKALPNLKMKPSDAKTLLEVDYGLLMQGHADEVHSLAVTSDSKYILSGSSDKTIRI